MPYSLTCPNFSAKLKTPNAIPYGRSVPCPKCKTPFTVDATNFQELPADGPPPSGGMPAAQAATAPKLNSPPPEPRKTAAVAPPPAPVKKAEAKKAPVEDDDEDAPRSRRPPRDEDEEELPRPKRGKKIDDEEEEAPRSRRKPAEDEEEEAPRSRKRGKDDDEEEAPRSRRKPAEDEEEEAPRSRGRGKAVEEEEAPRARGRGKTDGDDEEESTPRARRRGRIDEDEEETPRGRRGAKDEVKKDDDEAPRARKRGKNEDDEEQAKDEEETPRKRRGRVEEEDEEETPRSKRRGRDEEQDEEEKAPRSKRKGREEAENDEEERPRSRRRGKDDDEDDDDAPRSRRRGKDEESEDDYEGDEADRPKRRGFGKPRSKGMLYGMIGGGVLGVVGLVFLCIWIFGGSGGGYDKEMLALIPADVKSLNATDHDAIRSTKFGKQILEEESFGLKELGVDLDAVSKSYKAFNEKGVPVTVLRFSKAVDKGKITSAVGGAEQKANGKTYFKGNLKMAGMLGMNVPGIKMPEMALPVFLSFPTDELLLTSNNEDVIKEILGRKEGEIALKEDVMEFIGKVAKGQQWKISKPGGGMQIFVGPELAKAKWYGEWKKVSDTTGTEANLYLFGSSDEASKAAEESEKGLAKKKEAMEASLKGAPEEMKGAIRDAMNSTEISSSGNIVTVKTKIALSDAMFDMKKR